MGGTAAAYNLTGSQAALGSSAYSSYMPVPPNMGQGFADSSQSARNLPPSAKGPAANPAKNYGQNLYPNSNW